MAVMKNQKTGMWEVRTYYKDWTGTRRQKTKRGFAKKNAVITENGKECRRQRQGTIDVTLSLYILHGKVRMKSCYVI